MLEHVYERVSMARSVDDVIVATDDERIARECRRFGAQVRMTRSDHLSGTDRVAEVASVETAAIVVNVQGDEPLIDPAAIDAAVLPLQDEPAIRMSTLSKRIEDPREISDPNVVKVVTDRFQNALYFSRSPIPHVRQGEPSPVFYKHTGLYVYRRDFLLSYPDLPVGPLEQSERLEQLRALENGFKIRVVETEYESFGIDTPQDLERARYLFERMLQSVEANSGQQDSKPDFVKPDSLKHG
jgi:3-deoxy-manno-octulosonate cytidylyltransferase (CMP-KDO synthetase)